MECNCNDLRVSITESDDHLTNFKPQKTCGDKLKKYGRRKLPILSWIPKYKLRYLLSDLIGGITVWLTAVPQSMGDAAIAGLTPEYGLYSHFVGPLVYLFLGSCRPVVVGPTAVMSLLTYETCGPDFPECVILFTFYSGVVEMVLGLLELGVIISFISEPVTVGFTTGAAITIASTQIKGILGLAGKSKGSKFIEAWKQVIEYGDTITLGDTILGLTCLTTITLLWKIEHLKCPKWFSNQKLWKRIMKGLTLTRNATVMFLSCIIAYLWTDPPFALTGEIKQGFPDVVPPLLELPNRETNSTMSFTETLQFVGTGPVSVAVVAILQNIAIGKAFGHGQSVDGTQEMVALGATNMIGGFMSAIPATGSFTRSALNQASGTKSQLNGLFLGGLMILSLGVLTPTFEYVPKASLAAVIIAAMILILNTDVRVMINIWKVSKIDFLCCIVTFLCSLGIGMEYGIVIGAAANILIILIRSLRPRVTVQCLTDKDTRVKYVLLQPDQGLYFPSVDYIRDKVNKISTQYPNFPVTVIDCEKWTHWDYSAASTIASLGGNYSRTGKKLVLFKANSSWNAALDNLGSTNTICCANVGELREVFQSFLMKALSEKEDDNNN